MGRVLVSDTYLTDIANAIRGKNGSTDSYTPQQMASAIENIPSGGGNYFALNLHSINYDEDFTIYLSGITESSTWQDVVDAKCGFYVLGQYISWTPLTIYLSKSTSFTAANRIKPTDTVGSDLYYVQDD